MWDYRLLLATRAALALLPGPPGPGAIGETMGGGHSCDAKPLQQEPGPCRVGQHRTQAVGWMPQCVPGCRHSPVFPLKATPTAPRGSVSVAGRARQALGENSSAPHPPIPDAVPQSRRTAPTPGLAHRAHGLHTSSLFEGSVLLRQGTPRALGLQGQLQGSPSPAGPPLLSLSPAGHPGPESPEGTAELTWPHTGDPGPFLSLVPLV